jgi:hypothetical protein
MLVITDWGILESGLRFAIYSLSELTTGKQAGRGRMQQNTTSMMRLEGIRKAQALTNTTNHGTSHRQSKSLRPQSKRDISWKQ